MNYATGFIAVTLLSALTALSQPAWNDLNNAQRPRPDRGNRGFQRNFAPPGLRGNDGYAPNQGGMGPGWGRRQMDRGSAGESGGNPMPRMGRGQGQSDFGMGLGRRDFGGPPTMNHFGQGRRGQGQGQFLPPMGHSQGQPGFGQGMGPGHRGFGGPPMMNQFRQGRRGQGQGQFMPPDNRGQGRGNFQRGGRLADRNNSDSPRMGDSRRNQDQQQFTPPRERGQDRPNQDGGMRRRINPDQPSGEAQNRESNPRRGNQPPPERDQN